MGGYTSFIIHSGGTPVNFFLLPQKLNKTVYVATFTLVFLIINIIKVSALLLLKSISFFKFKNIFVYYLLLHQ